MSPKFLTCLTSTFRSLILHHISSLQARRPFLQFFRLSALISCFFCSTINAMSLLLSFMLFDVLLPLTVFSLLFCLLLLLLPSLRTSSIFLKHSGTSPWTLQCLSLPPPFPFRCSCSLVLLSFLSFSRLESRRHRELSHRSHPPSTNH